MKVSDEVLEVAAKAAAKADAGEFGLNHWREYMPLARAALEAALPLVLGEPVAEVSSAPFGVRYITCSDPEALAPGTKLYAPKEQQP